MGGSTKIGQIFGIDIKVHWTFFLLLIFFGTFGYIQTGHLFGAALSIGLIVVLFLFVLLHELGHSLVARRLGIEISDITLLPIGGMARMKSLPEKALDEVKISIAGPPVNLVLAAIFYAVAYLGFSVSPFATPGLGAAESSVGGILAYLGFINLLLAVFNLLPAFPMDGGRVLRGLLSTRMSQVRATNIASRVGQLFAALFFLFGLLTGDFILAFIAIFVWFGAEGEAWMAHQRELARGLTVSDVMGTKPHTKTVTPHQTVGQVLDEAVHGYQQDFPVVDEQGGLIGMITRRDILTAAHAPDKFRSVRDLMRTEFPTISPEAALFEDGARILQESGFSAIPVVDDGELVGMLTVEDLSQASLLRELRKEQF